MIWTHMNVLQKYLIAGSIALFGLAAPAFAGGASSLGTATGFSVLGGTNVTCTAGSVVGDVDILNQVSSPSLR